MGLLSFLQRKAAAGADPLSVDAARLRARRRLIGAVVLVALGVVGFPLLFDTSPRPVPLDIPIEIAEQQAASEPANAKPVPGTAPAPAAIAQEEVIADRAADTEREAAPSSAAPAGNPAPAAPADRTAEKRPEGTAEAPPPRKAAAAAPPPKAKEEAARALAALQGKSASGKPAEAPEATGRFVIQVGAFSEPASARQARQRVEKLGLKTYTQVVKTAAGERIRVRVGPYGDRGEADRAAARLKQAGLQPAVLTL